MKAISVGRTTDGHDLKLDVSGLLDTRLLIQGNSGAGKSWLMRLIAEQVAARVPTFILDPEGEYATLRERLDMVLVGQAGEVAADPRGAGLLARKLMELRVSAVIDLYDLKLGARREFVREFLDSLLNLPKDLYKSPVLIGIDEAHIYCPEKSAGESVATESVIALMSQGRKRGLCGALLTQRLSKLHKDAAAECNNVIIGRTWLDVDQARAGDALGLSSKDRVALRDLGKGEFLAFGPAFSSSGVTRFQSAAVQTTHPQAGKRHTIEAPAPSAAIKAVLPQLRDLPQQAAVQAKTVEDLRREIVALKRQVAAKPAVPAPVASKVVERHILKDGQITRLEGVVAKLEKAAANAQDAAACAAAQARETRAALSAAQQALSARGVGGALAPLAPTVHGRTRPEGAGRPAVTSRSAPVVPSGDLSATEQRVLDAIAWWEAADVSAPSKVQAGFMAGYRVGKGVGGTFGNILGKLRSAGLVDYPGAGTVALTDSGRAAARPPSEEPSTEAIHRAIRERLGSTEFRVLSVLIEAYPMGLSKQETGSRAGYEVGPAVGGTFGNILGRLRSIGLVDYPRPGFVIACPVLFLGGR